MAPLTDTMGFINHNPVCKKFEYVTTIWELHVYVYWNYLYIKILLKCTRNFIKIQNILQNTRAHLKLTAAFMSKRTSAACCLMLFKVEDVTLLYTGISCISQIL